MATYRKADPDASALLAEVYQDYAPELHEHGVTIELLFAFPAKNEATGEPSGPAIKFAGLPAAASVKVNSQKDRVAGKCDVDVILDGEAWPEWEDERRKAVLHHCLCFLELRRDEDGAAQMDDCNRPKLKKKPHDWLLAGFDAVAERHGPAALEVEAFQDLSRKMEQKTFAFAD